MYEYRRIERRRSAEQLPQGIQEQIRFERLIHVAICAQLGLGLTSIVGRENQYGAAHAELSQLAKDGQAVFSRHPEVEHHRVKVGFSCPSYRIIAVIDDIDV